MTIDKLRDSLKTAILSLTDRELELLTRIYRAETIAECKLDDGNVKTAYAAYKTGMNDDSLTPSDKLELLSNLENALDISTNTIQ